MKQLYFLQFHNSSRKELLNKILRNILLIFLFFATHNLTFGYNYHPSHSNLSIEASNHKINFIVPVFNEISGSNDDNLKNLILFVKDGAGVEHQVFQMKKAVEASGSWTWYDAEPGSGDQESEFRFTTFQGISATVTTHSNASGHIKAKVSLSIPISFHYLDMYNVRQYVYFEDAGSNYNGYHTHPPLSGWSNIIAPYVSTTNDECGQVNLSWNDVNSHYRYQVRNRESGGGWSNWSDAQGNNSYTHNFTNSALNPVNEREYQLKVGYSSFMVRSVEGSILSGGIPEVLDPPSSITASLDNCDSTILLSWIWAGNNPEGFAVGIFDEQWNPLLNIDIDGSARQFEFNEANSGALSPNTFYNIRIASKNKCDIESVWVNKQGKWMDLPAAPTNFSIKDSTVAEKRVMYLSWEDNAVNESRYVLKRTLFGEAVSKYINIGKDTTFYIDDKVAICNKYIYEIFAQNVCAVNAHEDGISAGYDVEKVLTFDLNETFLTDTNFSGSKGYFPNYVQLEWLPVNNSNLIEFYKIYRRLLGSNGSYTQIASETSGTHLYLDQTANAGSLYEYLVIGEAQCLTETVYTDTLYGVGFRSPTAIVNGQINYTGGIAVEGVKVQFETATNSGQSLQFDGTSNIKAKNNFYNSANNQTFYLETWIKPTSVSDFEIFDKSLGFTFEYESNAFKFYGGNLPVPYTLNGTINQNQWQHIGLKLADNSLALFINGVLSERIEFTDLITLDGLGDLSIGEGLTGYMDEIRIWNSAPSDSIIFRDYSRFLNGDEEGLITYLRCDEIGGNSIYDLSHEGVLYRKNDAVFVGNIVRSSEKPTLSQLSYTAYTNALGSYSVLIPYSGVGQNFTVTPNFETHQFSPATTALFLGDGSTVNNGVDFEDISSFLVTGTVFYNNSSCPSEKIGLYIDGNPVVANGYPVETASDGTFEINVPIGNHIVEVKKYGHTFSEGRFPTEGTFDFQEPVSGIEFIDSTFMTVVGRVVGGQREISKAPGFGKTKNNIGQAQVIFKSQLGNGCYTDTVFTDILTGEYQIQVPPLKFEPDVSVASNPLIKGELGVLDLIDIKSNKLITTVYDSVFSILDSSLIRVDSFKYHYQIDYEYLNTPLLSVTGEDGISEFSGDTVYTYTNPQTGVDTTISLISNPLKWPVFSNNGGLNTYSALVRVYEEYKNFDGNSINPIIDSVPFTEGKFYVNSEFSDGGEIEVSLSNVNTLDSIKTLIVDIPMTGVPNFLANTSIPDYSYTNTLEMRVQLEDGSSVFWLPVTNPITNAKESFRGYMLGRMSVGNQFITNGPDDVDFILRDPPGSGSYASREIGTTSSTSDSWDYSSTNEGESKLKIGLGAKFSSGIGISIETEISNDVEMGLKSEVGIDRSGSISTEITSTQEWSTDDGTDQTGAGSDLFVGTSRNVEFGIQRELTIIPDSECITQNCYGNSHNGMQIGEKNVLSVAPNGYETNFIYSQNHIKNYLIPEIKQKRNAMLQTDSRYVSHLLVSDENYGKSNDDIVFSSPSSSTPNVRESNYMDNSGESYTYTPVTPEDSLKDEVWSDNHQIYLWEKTLWENEWEKANIDNQQVRDSLKQVELDKLYDEYGLVIIEYSLFTASEILSASVTHIASMAGSYGAKLGSIGFRLTSNAGISNARVTNSYNEYISRREKVIADFDRTESNYSLSGGVSYTASMSHERTVSTEKKINYDISYALSLETKGKINNSGVEQNMQTTFSFSKERSRSLDSTESETTTFTLADGDQGDYMSVDVFPSLLGYGPIFKLKEGGRTSCPFEDEIVTEYYNPGTVISAKTLQRDKPNVSISPSIVQNVPMDGAAVFNLTLGNISESNDAREYNIQMVSNSNPHGAIVKVDGLNPENTIAINGNSSFNKTLTVEKGAGPVFNYDSLLFIITAPCQYDAGTSDNLDIADSVYFSAHFIPGCSEIDLATPSNQWVLNNSFNDTMQVSVVDYDINFSGLNRFRIDYKPSSQANWIGLESYYKDTLGINDADAKLIPTSTHFTFYDWDVKQLTDGNYDLRVVTECDLAGEESPVYSGVIDRVNPHAFGSPSPADGILSADEEISIKFNEDIESGSLSQLNFDIRGVLNGSEIRHQVSLEFDGTSSHVEIPTGLNLQSRDFTIEFWARTTSHTGERIFLSQGPGALEGLKIGIEPTGQVFFDIAGERSKTVGNVTNPDQWHHYAFAYDFEGETLELFIDGVLSNDGSINLYSDFVGSGKINIGKSTYGSDNYFKGNIHDLRIWNHTRTLSEIVINQSLQVGKHNLGLLHNWKMNEATGESIEDHIRFRNGILHNTEWVLNPGGYAIEFNALDSNPLIFASSNISFTDEMDFTLEFWFNGEGTSKETLFSNGNGNGLDADSISGWSITKDSCLHVLHNGIDFTAVPVGSFDGNWHHLALVLHRGSVLTAYLDGNSTGTMLSENFKEFGSDKIVIGSRYFKTDTVVKYDEYFTGSIDEVRIWNLKRSQQQINRDMRFKLKGDELGLISYFPFEDYVEDLGIFFLNENYTDQADTSHHITYVENSLSENGPKIKLPRPVEKVNFNYSVNGNEIILTPTSELSKIENVTLDITVKDILDLHGNIMQSSKTWIAYPDQNQIVWESELVTINILKDEPYSFTKKIVNSGGAAKNFTIENIPNWLTTNVEEGLIEPGSTFEITFSVVEDVNIGSYKEDIIVMTDFNYPERLTIDLKVNGVEPEWLVNPEDFEKSMSLIGQIAINDVVSIDNEDILYAFVGDECRGKANLQYIESTDKFVLFMDIYANTSAADTIKFKIWDASTGSIFVDVVPDDLVFATDGLVGSLLAPQLFSAYSKIQESYYLQSGWNWISFHLATADTLYLQHLLASLEHEEGHQIKTVGTESNTFATYSEVHGWLGQLRTTGVSLTKGYKLKITEADTLINIGDVVDPTDYPINLHEGWNWIGFVSIRPMNINIALGNLEATTGDLIKGRAQFSVYDEQMGWIGSLNTMYPGQCYMYKSDNATSFTFPYAGAFKQQQFYPYQELSDERWPVDYTSYLSNMSAVIELEACINDIDFTDWYVGFFDGTGACRSLATVQTIQDKYIAFTTAVGNDDLDLKPRLLSRVTGQEISLEGHLKYAQNTHEGSYESPVVIALKDQDCMRFVQPNNDDVNEEILNNNHPTRVYPSAFSNQIHVEYFSLSEQEIHLELVNSLGQIVSHDKVETQMGNNTVTLSKKLSKLGLGAYILRVKSNEGDEVFKVLKKN